MRIHDKPEIMHGFMHCMKECGLIPRFQPLPEVLILYSLARFKSKELVLAQKFLPTTELCLLEFAEHLQVDSARAQ